MMLGTALAAAPGPPLTPLKFPHLPNQSSPGWYPSPDLIIPHDSTDYERLARREANHHHYQQHGNHKTWYYYVTFGFYQFDDVESFEKAWRNLADEDHIDLTRSKLTWTEFHQYRMNKMQAPDLLAQWATKYAKPYLQKFNKDFLYATNLEYEEYTAKTINNKNDEENAWTEISRNTRRVGKQNSPSPPLSPRTQPHTPKTPETYYGPLQEPEEDADVIMLDDTDTQMTATPTPTTTNVTQATPKSRNTTTTNNSKSKPIQLRNPYKRKNKPVNRAFARQLQHLMEARTPPDRGHDDNISISTDETYTPSPTENETPTNIGTTSASITTTANQGTQPPGLTANFPNPTQRTTMESTNSISKTTYQPPPDPFILINDGTQRMTIRWRPENFDKFVSEPSEWDSAFTTILRYIFGNHSTKTSLVKWGEPQTPATTISLDTVAPEQIRQYLSPRISTLQGTKTFVFGMRLCAPDNHYNQWISQPTTREILREQKLEITVSNSKCSSGNVVTAGYILMKHPQYTHRYFYLLSLRKDLPSNTPFFDLANHNRTPDGLSTPHLVVKCGENHLTGLSEILSAHLDGQKSNTALFVASQAVKSMTQEEIATMFRAHTQFIDNIQRLALYPKVINIR